MYGGLDAEDLDEPADVDGYEGESEGCGYDLVELTDGVSGDESGDDPLSDYVGDGLDDVSRDFCFRLCFGLVVYRVGEWKLFLSVDGAIILLGARSSAWLEHQAHNLGVVGSNPSGPTFFCL